MPRGMHPNSQKALAEYRKKNQFRKGEKKRKEDVEKREQTKAAKRTFKEEFEAELSVMISQKDGNGKVIGKTTVKNAITKKAVQKALRGDLEALRLIRDTIGEKPVETIMVSEVDSSVIAEVERMVNDAAAGGWIPPESTV